MRRLLLRLLPPALPTDVKWLEKEETRQMQEVRDRLDRVRLQLSEIDRRKEERVCP